MFTYGRIPQFDEASRAYPLPVATTVPNVIRHRVYGAALNQGQSSSCTGHAMAAALNTAPIHTPRTRLATHDTALRLYSRATQLDSFPGEWDYPCPAGKTPDDNRGWGDDNGSSGLAVNKAAKEAGYTTSYQWAFGYNHVIEALPGGPILLGIWWYEGMERPDAKGIIHATGSKVGGHEVLLVGADQDKGLARIRNSWGTAWGINGDCLLPLDDLRTLLADQGDAVRPIKAAA